MWAILAPFFMQPKIPIAVEARGQKLYGSTYDNMNQWPWNQLCCQGDLENQLWYLLDEAVCLALFSDQLSVTDRVKILYRISAKPGERKMRGDATILKETSCPGESAIQRTPTNLSCLTNDDSFLLLPSDKWTKNQNNKQGRERIHQLRVEDDVVGSCSKNPTDLSPIMMKKKSDLFSKWSIKLDN